MLSQRRLVEPGPFGDVGLLVVVRDQRDPAPALLVRMHVHALRVHRQYFGPENLMLREHCGRA
jgi:hypothetical protein